MIPCPEEFKTADNRRVIREFYGLLSEMFRADPAAKFVAREADGVLVVGARVGTRAERLVRRAVEQLGGEVERKGMEP